MNGAEIRRRLYLVLPPHQTWCEAIGHFDCCRKTDEDCDCGVIESLNELLPVVRAITAEELREAAADLADDDESDPAYIASADLLTARADALDPQ